MKIYDLRSDTITKPTEEMRKAIYNAEVGDDVYLEDRTVNYLQDKVKELTGKEDALFVSSGSMGNLISLMIFCGRTNEVLCAKESHICQHEIGAVSAIANTLTTICPSENGILDETKLESYIKPYSYDMSKVSLIEVENTTSGLIYPIDKLKKIKELADRENINIHTDGARIFNAVVETGISLREYSSLTSSITFCLSKGLGCPVGSMLCGDKEFINLARRYRKLLGGGMRQIGLLAAAGIYALDNHVERLKDDHENCRLIKDAIEDTSWAEVATYGTNILFFKPISISAERVVSEFKKNNILVLNENNLVRVVTNLSISSEDAKEVAAFIRSFNPGDLK